MQKLGEARGLQNFEPRGGSGKLRDGRGCSGMLGDARGFARACSGICSGMLGDLHAPQLHLKLGEVGDSQILSPPLPCLFARVPFSVPEAAQTQTSPPCATHILCEMWFLSPATASNGRRNPDDKSPCALILTAHFHLLFCAQICQACNS